MSRIAASLLALGLCTATGAASAQSYQQDRGVERSGAYYDEARVIRVDPVFEDDREGYGDGYGYGDGRDRYRDDDRRAWPASAGERCTVRDDGYVDGYGDDRGYGGYGDDRYGGRGSETGRTVATVVGGVVGAVLGSKVGGGSGRYATSAIGTMVGSVAGREIYDASQRRRAQVTVCEPSPYGDDGYRDDGYRDTRASGVRWYDVTYEYGGRRHVTRTDYHPGDTLRVLVDVRPL